MSVFRSTTYTEVPGSPQETIGPNQNGAVRRLRVKWGDRASAVQDFLGYAQIQAGPTLWYNRQTPHRHPEYPQLYCESLIDTAPDVPEGFMGDGEGPVASYRTCVLTFKYTAPDHTILADDDVLGDGLPDETTWRRYVWPHFKSTHKIQTLPPFASLRWVSDGSPVSNQLGVLFGEADLRLEHRGVPIAGVNWATVYGLVGKCNVNQMGSAGSLVGIQPGGTLLFLGAEYARIYRQSLGDFVADVIFSFKIYPQGVNSFFRWNKTSPGFELATRDGTVGGGLVFPPADLTVLFRPMF